MARPRKNFAWQSPHEGSHLHFAAAVEFSKKLRRLMSRKAMSQSDLARECWGEEETSAGYLAAKGRDKINKYCSGKMVPDSKTLTLLARALEVPESELAPEVIGKTSEREHPEVRMTVIAGHRDLVHLSWNTVVPLTTALQMLALYQAVETRAPTASETAKQAKPYGPADAALSDTMMAQARALVVAVEAVHAQQQHAERGENVGAAAQ